MSSSVLPLRRLNRGLRRYKPRCYEQVRVAYLGMGCEWSHNYWRDEMMARDDAPDNSRRTEMDGHGETPEYHRTGMEFWGKVGIRDGQGVCGFTPAFESDSIRDNGWHRKRSEDCVNPPDDDEDWIDD